MLKTERKTKQFSGLYSQENIQIQLNKIPTKGFHHSLKLDLYCKFP